VKNYSDYIQEKISFGVGSIIQPLFAYFRDKLKIKNKYNKSLTTNPQIVSSFEEYFTDDEINLLYNKIMKDKKLMKYADSYFQNPESSPDMEKYARKKLTPQEIKKLAKIGEKLNNEGFFPDSWYMKKQGVMPFTQPKHLRSQ